MIVACIIVHILVLSFFRELYFLLLLLLLLNFFLFSDISKHFCFVAFERKSIAAKDEAVKSFERCNCIFYTEQSFECVWLIRFVRVHNSRMLQCSAIIY